MKNPFDVSNKRVLITGGTAGIGLAVASHLSSSGADVIISGRRGDGAEIATSIDGSFVQMDVGDDDSVTAAFNEVADGGQLDSLILNAGIEMGHGEITGLDVETFGRVLDINTMGVVRAMAAGVGLMGAGGSVVVTSSPAGSITTPGMAAYSASKAAVDMLVRTWALELGPKGIRVNAVLPGIVESEMNSEGAPALELIRRMTANGTYRPAADMGPVFHFLVSDASAPLTGSAVGAHDGISVGYSHETLSYLAANLGGDESD